MLLECVVMHHMILHNFVKTASLWTLVERQTPASVNNNTYHIKNATPPHNVWLSTPAYQWCNIMIIYCNIYTAEQT